MTLSTHELLSLLAVVLGGGVAASVVAQAFKKLFKLQTPAVIHTVVVTFAVLAAVAQYIGQIHSQLPPAILGFTSTTIYGFSQLAYKYASYASNFMNKVNAYASAQPPEGLPEVTAAPEAEQTTNTTPPPIFDV